MRLETLIAKPILGNNVITLQKFSVPVQLRDFRAKWDVRNIFIPRKKEFLEYARYAINCGVQFILEIPKRKNLEVAIYFRYKDKFYSLCTTCEDELDGDLNNLIRKAYIFTYLNSNSRARD